MYKYLLFDADGTLLDFDSDMKTAFYSMYRAAQLDRIRSATPELHALYNTLNNKWWALLEQGACTKPELFVNRFRDFIEAAELPGVQPEVLNRLYFDALGATGTLYAGAAALLGRLCRSAEIYIVTNGNAQTQHTRLRNSGLLNFAADYFISDDAGAAKPDKRYFDYVLERIPGARAADCIVIGDSLSADIQGAVNAGIDCIWYNPLHKQNTARLPVTFEADSYDQIRRFLEEP